MSNPLSTNPTKWSNTLKHTQLSVAEHFVGLRLKGLKHQKSCPGKSPLDQVLSIEVSYRDICH